MWMLEQRAEKKYREKGTERSEESPQERNATE